MCMNVCCHTPHNTNHTTHTHTPHQTHTPYHTTYYHTLHIHHTPHTPHIHYTRHYTRTTHHTTHTPRVYIPPTHHTILYTLHTHQAHTTHTPHYTVHTTYIHPTHYTTHSHHTPHYTLHTTYHTTPHTPHYTPHTRHTTLHYTRHTLHHTHALRVHKTPRERSVCGVPPLLADLILRHGRPRAVSSLLSSESGVTQVGDLWSRVRRVVVVSLRAWDPSLSTARSNGGSESEGWKGRPSGSVPLLDPTTHKDTSEERPDLPERGDSRTRKTVTVTGRSFVTQNGNSDKNT